METILAEKRQVLGKKVKTLRRHGILPAVLYGKGKKSENLSVRETDFLKIWKSAGESTILELKIDNSGDFSVLIQDVDIDPLKEKPLHVDFFAVDMTKKIKVEVPIEFVGESEAVKAGGVLVKVLHSLEVEAMPKDLPHSIEADVSLIKSIGASLTIKDVKIPKGVEILSNSEETIVVVEEPRVEEETAPEAAEAESLENIEVIKKEKTKLEEGEAETKTPEQK